MSLESFLPEEKPATLNGKPVNCKPVTLRQTIRVAALADRIKDDINKSRAELAVEAASGNLPNLVVDVVSSLVGQIDLDDPNPELKGNALIVCRELGALVGVSPDDVADASLDELHDTALKMWEVNKAGPFGRKMVDTIATFTPMIAVMAEAMAAGFSLEFTKALRPGGIPDGGMTGLSSHLPGTSDGPTDTFLMDYPSDESSSLSQVADTTEESSKLLMQAEESPAEENQAGGSPEVSPWAGNQPAE